MPEPTSIADPSPTRPLHALPPPFSNSPDLEVLTQGAEALIYRTTFLTPSTPCILKYRPPKPYRHPVLDRRLTKARLLAEARVLVKCRKEGGQEGSSKERAEAIVPAVLGADWEAGWLCLEYIEGRTVRNLLDEYLHTLPTPSPHRDTIPEETQPTTPTPEEQAQDRNASNQDLWDLMRRVGRAVGRLHEIGVCHGDLTTSNLMVRTPKPSSSPSQQPQAPAPRPTRQTPSAMREAAITGADAAPPPAPPSQPSSPPSPLSGAIVLIDFGLATQSIQDEDRAVDLYVLERAFAATHPTAENLFREVLRCYGESFKGAKVVLRRLEDVRLRGRKRSMVG